MQPFKRAVICLLRSALGPVAGAMLGALPAWSGAQPAAPVERRYDNSLAIESCVSDARIHLGADDLRVMLDGPERAAVHAQLMQRYPAAQHDGVVPSHIVLWRQPAGAWVYVALLQHPAQPGQWCFTASFVARGVDLTTALLRKYFALHAA
jgi:hypothetical protein